MTLSLNHRAHELADRMAADSRCVAGRATRTLPGGDTGDRLRQRRARRVRGGPPARRDHDGRTGLGRVRAGRGRRSLPPRADGRHRPSRARVSRLPVRRLADRPRGLLRDGQRTGRALIRAEELFDDLDVDERASEAVLCLETRDEPPAELAAHVAERAGVAQDALTLIFAPTASLAGGVQIAARIVETALHKLHELDFDVRRVVSGFGTCPLPPVARTDPEAIGRRTTRCSRRPGGAHRRCARRRAGGDHHAAARLGVARTTASRSERSWRRADWDFYAIDPLLFSPAEVRLVSVGSGRSFQAGGVEPDVLERSFRG